jgi:hypothetical protein
MLCRLQSSGGSIYLGIIMISTQVPRRRHTETYDTLIVHFAYETYDSGPCVTRNPEITIASCSLVFLLKIFLQGLVLLSREVVYTSLGRSPAKSKANDQF